MELLLLQIAKDWRRTTVKTEIEILSKSGEEARFLVLFYTGFYSFIICRLMKMKNGDCRNSFFNLYFNHFKYYSFFCAILLRWLDAL